MKFIPTKIILAISFFLASMVALAQEDAASLHQKGRTFMQAGDYANATLVYKKALEQAPANTEIQNDLLFNYYLSADYGNAMQYGRQLTDKPGADLRSFQLLGLTYRAIEEIKEAERLYKRGIEAYPKSGVLYNEYGELLYGRKKYEEAAEQWEKGIAVDPNYSGNYYNAAKHYYRSADKTWALLYGEIFLNLESYSRRTPEIKQLLLGAYKKYYTNMNGMKAPDKANGFEMAFTGLLNKHASVVGSGITTPSITIMRTRFILDWFEKEPVKFPYRLFEYHRQLLQEGLFDAYNQWIFGAAQNLSEFQAWTLANQKAYDAFSNFQKGRVFKLPEGQNYR